MKNKSSTPNPLQPVEADLSSSNTAVGIGRFPLDDPRGSGLMREGGEGMMVLVSAGTAAELKGKKTIPSPTKGLKKKELPRRKKIKKTKKTAEVLEPSISPVKEKTRRKKKH